MPCDSCYKSKSGVTYGLYQRFPWDETNIPFGSSGSGRFKTQASVDPGKYTGPSSYKTSSVKGGKFGLVKERKEKNEGPNPSTYFGLGRSSISTQSGKFDRATRVLPTDK
jgi:hypothetical protein